MISGASSLKRASIRRARASTGWINSISTLLEKGESKLLSIVESGKMPLYLAVQIARSDFNDSQNLIVDAFDEGKIKGKNITKIRDIFSLSNICNPLCPEVQVIISLSGLSRILFKAIKFSGLSSISKSLCFITVFII